MNFTNGERYDDDNLKAVRGQLRLLPHEYVTLDLAGHYTTEAARNRAAPVPDQQPGHDRAASGPDQLRPRVRSGPERETFRFATELGNHYYLDTYGSSLVAGWEGGASGSGCSIRSISRA